MLFWLRDKVLDFILISSSSIAAKKAKLIRKYKDIVLPKHLNNKGKQNIKIPTILLAYVWSRAKLRYFIKPINIDINFIIVINIIKSIAVFVRFIIGIKINIIIKTKIKSAMLSSVAPKEVFTLNFLAKNPSKISLSPHRKYITKNNVDNGFINKSKLEKIILKIVIIFGIYLI